MRRLLALATVAASLLSILASPFDARYVKAEMQAARARVPISTLVAPPNVASYFVSLTNTLMKPAYLDDAFHDAALIFRDQVAHADLPGATPLISLVSLSPSGNDEAATVGVFVITYADGAGVTVDSLRDALNKPQFLHVITIIDGRNMPVPSSPDDNICHAIGNEKPCPTLPPPPSAQTNIPCPTLPPTPPSPPANAQRPKLKDLKALHKVYDHDHNDHIVYTSPSRYERVDAAISYEGAIGLLSAVDGSNWCPQMRPLHRWFKYSSNCDNFATSRYNQNNGPAGYTSNVTLGYCVPKQNQCGATVPLYQLYNKNNKVNDHMLTSDEFERDAMVQHYGYTNLGVDCYAWPLEPAWLIDNRAEDNR